GGPAGLSNVVQGNYVGVDAGGNAGARELGNAFGGILVNNLSTQFYLPQLIGGSSAGAGNLIAGNRNFGIQLTGPQNNTLAGRNNVVQGNVIGLDRSGRLDTNGTGVFIDNSPNNLIG